MAKSLPGSRDAASQRAPVSARGAGSLRPWTIVAAAWCVVWFAARVTITEAPAPATNALLWGRLPLLLAAVWIGVRAANAQRDEPRLRQAWLCLTAAIGVLLPGDMVLLHRQAQGLVENGAAAFFYLGYFPLVLAGILLLPRVFRSGADSLQFILDAAMVVVGGGLLLWQVGVRPILEAAGARTLVDVMRDAAYPLGDLLTLLAIAAVLLRRPPGAARRWLALLAIPLLLSLGGDTLWVYSNLASRPALTVAANLLWLLQPVGFIAAAEQALRREGTSEPASGAIWQPAFGWLPYVALAVGYGVLVGAAYTTEPARLRELLPGALVLTALVVVRQWVAQRENAALLAEQVRRADEARFAALVRHAGDAIVIMSPDLRPSWVSPHGARLLAGADDVGAALHPDDRAALRDYAAAAERGQVREATLGLRFGREPGPWVVTEAVLTNLLADPTVHGLVLTARDVGERRALEEQLRAQALRDPLTGLANRELFLDRVALALKRAQEAQAGIAIAVLDLDRFTLVNDSLGHRVGDRVLAQTAARIAGAVGGADSVARIGGDDFGVLFEDVAGEEVLRERVERVRAALAHPLRVDGQSVRLTATAGVALGHSAATLEALLRNADIALQQARSEGGDCAELFRADRHGRVVERLALESELPRLLEREAFRVDFEPVIAVPGCQLAGLFLRLNWRDPAQAPFTIAAVQAAARDSSSGLALGRWSRQTAMRDVSALIRYLPETAELAIGLRIERGQLKDEHLVSDVAALLTRTEMRPRNLFLEIPESALSPVTGPAAHAIERLRELGVSLALGEFGAAYAAFELLDQFPFDGLTLADTLVGRVDSGGRPGALVRAAIATGRSLGMRVLAPGVRSKRQLELLAELGCQFASGPELAPLMSYEHALTWLGARFAEAREAG
jgi:diguanylate cyclase (GGDEF)-like protein